jgi:hypothetical protein
MIGSNKKGITVVEMLVVLWAYTTLLLLISGILSQASYYEKRAAASAIIQENVMFILETISKEMRISEIITPDTADCRVSPSTTLQISREVPPDYNSTETITYSLTNGQITRAVGTAIGVSINSPDVTISNLRFCISGSGANDNEAERVTVAFTITNNGPIAVSIPVQTTLTSRNTMSEMLNQ